MPAPTLSIPKHLQVYFSEKEYTPDEVALIWIKISQKQMQEQTYESYPVNLDIADFRRELAELVTL